jgi:transcriptional antiterminator RfaH
MSETLWRDNQAERNWFAVQLKPNSFRIAERSLLRQDFRVFCPKTKKTVVKFGKPRVQIASLFSGYLFAQIDEARHSWRAISNTYGVSRIIADAQGVPSYLPSAFMKQLLLRCDEEGFILPPPKVSPGDKVRLARGPFSEFVARVERIDDRKMIWILLDILGGSREVEVKIEDLIKDDAA